MLQSIEISLVLSSDGWPELHLSEWTQLNTSLDRVEKYQQRKIKKCYTKKGPEIATNLVQHFDYSLQERLFVENKCWRFFQIRLVCLNRILTRISVDHNILQLLSMPFKRSVSKLLLFHGNFLFFYSSLSQWMTLITCLKGLCYCSGCVSQHGIYVSHSEREGRI